MEYVLNVQVGDIINGYADSRITILDIKKKRNKLKYIVYFEFLPSEFAVGTWLFSRNEGKDMLFFKTSGCYELTEYHMWKKLWEQYYVEEEKINWIDSPYYQESPKKQRSPKIAVPPSVRLFDFLVASFYLFLLALIFLFGKYLFLAIIIVGVFTYEKFTFLCQEVSKHLRDLSYYEFLRRGSEKRYNKF